MSLVGPGPGRKGGRKTDDRTLEDIPLDGRRALNVMETEGASVFMRYVSGDRP